MISDFFYSLSNIIKSRIFIVSVIIIVMFSALFLRIFNLQIVNEDYYMNTYIQKAEKTIYTPGTRGQILDKNGNVLAYNKVAYSVTFEDVLDKSDTKDEQLNTIAYNAITIIEKYGDKLNVSFPITRKKNGSFEYSITSETAKLRFLKNIFGEELDTKEHKRSESTAEETFKYMCENKFEVDDHYDDQMKMKILAIRYNLFLNLYQKYVATTIATDVSEKTRAAIYENEARLAGVTIKEQSVRVYNYSQYFAPILGYTGTISEEQLEEYNAQGKKYILSDVVGKAGLEATLEDNLKGKRGEEKIFVDSTGKVLSTISKKDSKAGNNVSLTIDLNLQIAAYDLLEKKIAGILISQIVNYDVNPEGDSESDNHPIGVKQVYFQLINNNVVSIEHLAKKSTSNETRVYNKYTDSLKTVVAKVKDQLKSSPVKYKDLSDEYKDYHLYIYDMLKDDEVINVSAINTEDDVFKKWKNGDISLKDFLKYAIANDWIDVTTLEIEGNYTTTEETYEVLVDYIVDMLKTKASFAKRIFYYKIYDGTISGSEICMLLYDQKVLKKDEQMYNSLSSYSSVTSYNFIVNQIKKLKITPAQIALDPCSGSIVITDPNNGDVLALVTYPSYDNNMLSGYVDPDYWAKLIDDKSDPLYNRATQGLTAPGSTFKMASAMAGLEENALSSPYSTITTHGIFDKIKPSPKCWIYPGSHGPLNVMDAIAQSCNCFFYEVAYRLGTDGNGNYNSDLGLKKMKKYTDMLGISKLSGVEITESNPAYSTESAVHSAIGQGSHSYAPVQLARYLTTLANGSKNHELTLIDKVTSAKGKLVKENKPKASNTVDVADSTWDAVHTGMRSVITKGTVKNIFAGMKIDVAGKSGTAQENTKRNSHALFVAYAPYKNPEMTVTTVIPFGNSSGSAAELTRDVVKYYFGELNSKDIANADVSTSNQRTHD